MHMRNALRLSVLLIIPVSILLLGAASCGGDDDNSATTTATAQPTATAVKEGPGRIMITTSSPIEGKSGKILLIFAIPSGGGERAGRLCAGISSDSFQLQGVPMTDVPAGNDPCASGTAETTFDEGTYQLTAGVYEGGQQTPESEVTLTVTVAGDTTAELDGAALSE